MGLEPAPDPIEQLADGGEQRVDGDHRPLELHPLGQGRRRLVRHQGLGIDAAGGLVGGGAGRTETARDPVGGQPGETAEGGDAPAAEGLGEAALEPEVAQRQRGEEGGLATGRNHGRRTGLAGGDAGRELVGGDADADRADPWRSR